VSRETTEQAEAYERTQAELQRMYREKGDAARRGVANSNALREMLEEQVRQEQSLIRAREDVKKEIARERKTLAEQKETAHVLEEQVERSTAFLKEVETVRYVNALGCFNRMSCYDFILLIFNLHACART